MNKKILIWVGIVLLFVLCIGFVIFFRNFYLEQYYSPGAEKIATQEIAIVYHPYNEGIKELASIIQSRVGGDVYKLEPEKAFPESGSMLSARLDDEIAHPEKISLKKYDFSMYKYHIIFIGVPIINGKISPVMVRFLLDQESLFKPDIITIPFVYYPPNVSSRETYQYIYSKTYSSTAKNGFSSTIVDKDANEMNIDIWLKDINFKHSELKKPSKEKAAQYKKAIKLLNERIKEERANRIERESAPAKFDPKSIPSEEPASYSF